MLGEELERHGESEWSEGKQIFRKMLKKNEWKCMQQKKENNRKVKKENEAMRENEVKEKKYWEWNEKNEVKENALTENKLKLKEWMVK